MLFTLPLILVARIEVKKEYWFWSQAGLVWKDVPSACLVCYHEVANGRENSLRQFTGSRVVKRLGSQVFIRAPESFGYVI